MGLIKNGVYYPDVVDNAAPGSNVVKSIAADNRLDREYENHAHELIQPNLPDGSPNPDFIEYYPDVSKDYGFIKEEE